MIKNHNKYWKKWFKTVHTKVSVWGLPWWCSGSEATYRVHGFDPWSGKIPHATEQLSSCGTATQPAL